MEAQQPNASERRARRLLVQARQRGIQVRAEFLRLEGTRADDKSYLAEFQGMWEKMLENLQDKHKETFREEIEHRLNSEFRHCGTLGKELIR